jgi:hypothetical protein
LDGTLLPLSRSGSRQELIVSGQLTVALSRPGSFNDRDKEPGEFSVSRLTSKELMGILDVDAALQDDPAPATLSRVSSKDSAKDFAVFSRTSSRDSEKMFLDVFTETTVPLSAGLEGSQHNAVLPNLVRTGSRGAVTKLSRTESNELILGACCADLSPTHNLSPTSKLLAQYDSGRYELELPTDSFEFPGSQMEIPQPIFAQEPLPLQPGKKARHSFDGFGGQLTQCNSFESTQLSTSAPNLSQVSLFAPNLAPNFSNFTMSHGSVYNTMMAVDSPRTPHGAPTGPDEWEGKRIVMKKGKYAGRGAFVKERVNKKYRVEIDGVNMKLEFYPTSFAHV